MTFRPAALLAVPVTLALLLAACVPPPAAAPAPAPTPPVAEAPQQPPPPIMTVALPPTPIATDWTAAQVTQGDWHWRMVDAQSVAEFRSPEGRPLAAVACIAGQQRVFLGIIDAAAGQMTVRTETATRTLATQASGPFAQTLLPPQDPLLDAIAFSRGHFALESQGRYGEIGLYLPSYPEITRVIEDCR